MKKYTFVLLLLCLWAYAYASENWIIYQQKNGVTIQYKYADCLDSINGINQQKVLIRFVNNTSNAQNVKFYRQATYSNDAQPGRSENIRYELTLQGNEVQEGKCESRDKRFYFFSKHIGMSGRTLIKFELKNITVTPLQ